MDLATAMASDVAAKHSQQDFCYHANVQFGNENSCR